MREAVQESGGHLRVAENAWPFAESEIGGDDDRGAFVETADHVEQELSAGLREGEIAKLVEDDEVEAREIVGQPPLTARSALGLEAVDEIDGVEEATRDPSGYSFARSQSPSVSCPCRCRRPGPRCVAER